MAFIWQLVGRKRKSQRFERGADWSVGPRGMGHCTSQPRYKRDRRRRECGNAVSHLLRFGDWALVCRCQLRLSFTMYIELHACSAFSFLEGASVPEELAETCAQYQMPAMALLDRDGVYGAARFHLAAQKLKMKAHI